MPAILLAIAAGTRDALIVGPQPLLIFRRHRAAIALAQIAHRVLLDRVLLQLVALQAEAAERIVQFALGRLGRFGSFLLAASLRCCHRSTNRRSSASRPTQFLEQLVVDFLSYSVDPPTFDHEIGLLPRIFQIRRVAFRRFARDARLLPRRQAFRRPPCRCRRLRRQLPRRLSQHLSRSAAPCRLAVLFLSLLAGLLVRLACRPACLLASPSPCLPSLPAPVLVALFHPPLCSCRPSRVASLSPLFPPDLSPAPILLLTSLALASSRPTNRSSRSDFASLPPSDELSPLPFSPDWPAPLSAD